MRACPTGCCLSGCRSRSLAGALLAYLVFPGVGWAAAALVATILAPTDAALGLAVVTNRAVPVRIRRALNVESGLNDGIATPFVTLFIALVAAEDGIGDRSWGLEALKQIGLAIVAAVVVGYLGGKLLALANDHGWTSGVSEQIAILALALLAYEGSVAIGGNGFIAAFAGGILFGAATRGRLEAPTQFTETLGLAASFLVWSIFGGLFVGKLFTEELSAQPIIYAVLSLTVIRMVPVAIALIGNAPAAGHRGLHGLVRPARAGLRRLHAHRPGGARAWRQRGDAPCRPPRGRSCSPWSCTASRRRHWPPGTGRRSRRRATSRRRRRRVSPRSGFTTWRAAIATEAAGTRNGMSCHRPADSRPAAFSSRASDIGLSAAYVQVVRSVPAA